MMQVVIIGGPLCGKSTFAQTLGIPTFCTDPASTVRTPSADVTYCPEGLDWEAQSDYIATQWLTMGGSWVIEGVGAARALRKFRGLYPKQTACTKVLLLTRPMTTRNEGQEAMAKSVATVWKEIEKDFKDITHAVI